MMQFTLCPKCKRKDTLRFVGYNSAGRAVYRCTMCDKEVVE